MNEVVKHRIEQIKRGEVPEGYKKTKVGIVPEEWNENSLGEYLTEYRELSNDIHKYPVYSSSRKGLLPQSEYYDNREAEETNLGYKIVPNGYVTYRHMSDDDIFHFNINQTGKDILVSSEYPVFTCNRHGCMGYIIPLINEIPRFRYFCRTQKMGGTRTRLYYKNLCSFHSAFPPLAEQEKIAEILVTQDKVIALKEKLLEEKKKQKKYLMQQLLTGKKRLPGFSGEWEKANLSSVSNFCFDSIDPSRYPNETFCVYSLPAFDNSMTPEIMLGSEISSGKFKLTSDVILFNKLNVRQKRVWLIRGSLLPNSVSSTEFLPLILHDICEEYLYFYLSSDSVVNIFIRKSSGTSNSQQRILPDDLMKLSVLIPPQEEQIAIAKTLTNADKEISIIQKSIDQEKQKKKALMQLLLTGIVRCNNL